MAKLSDQLAMERHSPNLIEQRASRMEELELQVAEHAQGVVQAFMSFSDVSPDATEPPDDWVFELGEEAARKKLEVAKAGWLPMHKAPAGAQVAARIWVGINRARQHKAQIHANQLNVKISLPAPTSAAHPEGQEYEVIDVE